MALIKSGAELVALGHDLVARGDWSEALERFNEAARKFQQAGDAGSVALARAYAAVASAALRPQDPASYRSVAEAARGLGSTVVKLGLRETSASDLAAEADLLAEEIQVAAARPATPEGHRIRAQALQALSMKFRSQVGDRVLTLPELFRQGALRGAEKALPLAAMAEEALAESLLSSDPKAAAERYQSARLWWSQAGYTSQADAAAARTTAYSRSATCWFCGREVTGEGVHFYSMPSELTEVVRKDEVDAVLPAFNSTATALYACRGCHSAIVRLADQIAYRRAKEIEAIVDYKIEVLRREIAAVRMGMSH